MSTRRHPGDLVRLTGRAGFGGGPGLWRIAPDGFIDWCPLDCTDPECVEWFTLWEVDADGRETGRVAYHVSECEMEDP
jgi:hypothetical protein